MMLTMVETATTKTHMSLHVADLGTAVEFYRTLFGIEPTKRYADYAKFELHDPPVVFSLQPGARRPGASLSHIGLRLTTPEAVERIEKRLAAAGIPTSRQDNVVCGYARQSKCWVADPDNNYWEIYVLTEDVDPASVRACLTQLVPIDAIDGQGVTWEHRTGQPLTRTLPHGGGSVDEIRLLSTLNVEVNAADTQPFLAELRRVMRPGGCLKLRFVAANTVVTGRLSGLPGWAAKFNFLPTAEQVVDALGAAGFVSVQIKQIDATPAWTGGDLELRDTEVLAYQPSANGPTQELAVLYRGPFREAVDFAGNVYPRGQRVPVNERTWNELRRGDFAEQFLFAVPNAKGSCGGDQ